MLENYKSLSFYDLKKPTHVLDSDYNHDEINLDSPAISVMKDFRKDQADTIQAGTSLSIAKKRLAKLARPILMVVSTDQELLGLLTARDMSDEKLINYIKEEGCTIDDVKVENIMTPKEKLSALFIQDVLKCRIGDVLHTLNDIGSGVVLVTTLENDEPAVRGIFTASFIAKKLGILFDPIGHAKNFAELAKVLHGSR